MVSEKVNSSEENCQTSPPSTPVDLAGRVLYERFLIERDLSEPPVSNIISSYLAKDLKHFCRRVILKAVRSPESSIQSNAFQDICETLIRLDHPNIEWILETGRLFDGRPYAVTTFTSGGSLDRILEWNRRLVLDRVANIVESVAAGLSAAHSRKILHANVTPWNIFITPEDEEAESVRLTNFGCLWPTDSKLSQFLHMSSGSGSLCYTAPELMVEGGRATAAADIYSLAVVTYKMLTGNVPFMAASRDAMLELIVKGVPAKPTGLRTDLSADAEAILLSAMQYKPLMRPRDVRAFGTELANELRNLPSDKSISRPANEDKPARVFDQPIIQIEVETQPAVAVSEPRRKHLPKASTIVSDKAIAWALIALLLAGALSIPIGQTILHDGEKPGVVGSIVKKSSETGLPRQLRLSIQGSNESSVAAQKSQPQRGNGVLNGDGYGITFEADAGGNAYVFAEAADEEGRPVFNVLYPLTRVNGGSARIEPNHEAKTRPGRFSDNSKPEVVWLVWTAAKHDDLEAARQSAFEADSVVRAENDVQKVKHFLERGKNNKLDVRRDEADGQTVVSGSGDRIVYRIELERP
jgi:serine/threonine protein kinase